MRNNLLLFLLFISFGIFTACNPTRHIPEGKYLLVKTNIKTDSKVIAKEKFEPLIKQKPNRKILGLFRFHLWVYNKGVTGKEKKYKKSLQNIGEAPVVLDSELTDRSRQQFTLLLNKNGFFNAQVTDSVKTRKKKASITYHIKFNAPYTIHSISYATLDTGISPLINYFQQTSLLLPGNRYEEEIFSKERERITNNLKDRGYYFFNRNYITYQIDSSLGTHQIDINLYINRVNENIGSAAIGSNSIMDHQAYKLRNIYIQTDFNPKDINSNITQDTTLYNGYYILSAGKYRILRDNVLVRNLYIKPGDKYHQTDLDFTYKNLQDLNVFKFINLYFREVPRDSSQNEYLLDLQVQLTPVENQNFTLESEATNTGGNIGIAGSFGYRNKNTFRGAEVLDIKLKGGLEAIPNFNDAVEKKRFFFFNTYEIGPEISLTFKKLLLLPSVEKLLKRDANPKTSIVLGYNQQVRPDYNRSITNFSYSWNANLSKRLRLLFYLADINAVKVTLSPEFRAKLEGLNDQRLLYTYDTHIISSIRTTLIYTNQNLGKTKNFIYLRVSPEVSVKLFNANQNPSEFFKADYDFSYHHYINPINSVVYRLAMGFGLPYGNSRALPFEKSFFAGGANSVRAWSARTLGPGSYKKTINIEQSGDIKIESNIEYRSELMRFPNGIILEGAAFVDAGNIWTRNEDIGRPDGKFELSHIIEEFGIGAGSGLRFNFSFFILRLDAAVKLRDPSLDLSKRWVYPNQKFGIGDFNWNLAIGYPF